MKAEYIFVPHTKTAKRLHRQIAEQVAGRKLEYDECVHHINGNKTDNRVENLAIISRSEHSRKHCLEQWDNRTPEEKKQLIKRLVSAAAIKNRKPVVCIKDGIVVRSFNSITDAESFGFTAQHICQCCKGYRKTHKGYGWKYLPTIKGA